MKLHIFVLTFVTTGMILAQCLFGLQPADRAPNLESPGSNRYSNVYGDLNYSYTVNSGARSRSVQFLTFGMEESRRQTIVEDTAILDLMINKALPPSTDGRALGVVVSRNQVGKIHALYVEGSGLVLVNAVRFPVAPLEESDNEELAQDDPPSSEWERAKQALNQSARRKDLGVLVQSVQPDSSLIMDYNPRRVDRLDSIVRKALNQINNFRDLAANDSVTVFIYGTAPPSEGNPMRSVAVWRARVADVKSETADGSIIQFAQFVERDLTGITSTLSVLGPSRLK